MKVQTLISIVIFGFSFLQQPLFGQTYFPDSLFATNGVGLHSSDIRTRTMELYQLSNKKYIVCGRRYEYFPTGAELAGYGIVRFTECGQVDSSYGVNGQFQSSVATGDSIVLFPHAFELLQDESILMAGTKNTHLPVFHSRPLLLKVLPNGKPDPNFSIPDFNQHFNPLITNSIASFYTVHSLSDGKIMCTGHYQEGDEIGLLFARLNSNGSLDSTFHATGFLRRPLPITGPYLYVTSAIDLKDGRVQFISWDVSSTIILATNYDGLPDSSFGQNGMAILYAHSSNRTYAKHHEGKTIIAQVGDNDGPVGGVDGIAFLDRFLSNGRLDSTFGKNGTVKLVSENIPNAEIHGFDILPDNRILVGGGHLNPNTGVTFLLSPNGSLDSTFGLNGRLDSVFNGNATTYSKVKVLPDGRWMLAGDVFLPKGYVLTRYTPFNLVPHLAYNGTAITSGVASNSVKFQWYLNGGLLIDSVNSVLQNPQTGNYVLTVIDTVQCGQYSDTLSLTTLAIADRIHPEFRISPNPVVNHVAHISGVQTADSYGVFDITGRVIKSGTIEPGTGTVDLSAAEPGMYLFKTGSGTFQRIVVK